VKYRKLGRTDLSVSEICLGTMTWGQQNTEAEGHQQLDMALDAGVNFIDAAEIYPVPPHKDTHGATERIIGTWLKARGNRDRVIVASKVAGPAGEWMAWLRDGKTCLDRRNIETAVQRSLQRLQTDYIDLYQLHWPSRRTNFFGKLGYTHEAEQDPIPIGETLGVLADLVAAGKIRHVGVSNETPWGTMRYLQCADHQGLPRIQSIQNPYNLLNRSFEVGLAEIAHRENVGLLAYSPMAFGTLSGKYAEGARPAGARLTLFKEYTRYSNPRAASAIAAYVDLAHRHGLSPAAMALAFVTARPFVTSNIIGATSPIQLEENLASADLTLDAEVLDAIEEIHTDCPNPCP
jgi:aryl-alcohol dehydrogenase-like predicted oxidoreductase